MFPIGRGWSVLAICVCLPLVPCSASPAREWQAAAEAHFQRGMAYDDKLDYPSTIADYTDALRLDYAPPQVAYSSRGTAYLNKGDTDKALAFAYAAKGEKAKADDDFARARKLGYVSQVDRSH
jgi:tetratricopeptide (TPR) repeat protein